ncbi:MAG: molybdopterin-dependent oxidoreductase, partial [Sporomusaceae bacterium]|nr:molybdopterin-dependent oxidoreductase [Sporomusaceae bacterium]
MKIPKNNYVDDQGVLWKKSRCFFCHMNCAILIGTKDNIIVAVEPNDDHGTVLCDRIGPHGKRAIKFHYHPKRINRVLKRAGKKGEDKWIEMDYDEALDEVAAKLKAIKEKYGAEAIASSEGTYRSDHLWARTRFMNLFGNPGNVVDPGTICWCYTYTVNMAMVGWPIEAIAPPTAPDADVIVIWGLRNDERYGPESPIWRGFMASLEREGKKPKVIVVDPVCIGAVQYADSWLAINPGTDAFMIMTWANYMVENDLYDKDFIKEWSNGPFLIRKDNKLLVRGSDVDKNGKFEDFVAWNDKTNKFAIWCSDENRYYDGDDIDTPIFGEFQVKMADGSTVTCVTAFTEIKERLKEYTIEKAVS